MRLKMEKTEGKMIRDQRSIAFTSVRSGILIFSCEDRLRRRLRFIWAERSREWRLAERGPMPPLCLRYWMCAEAVLSNCTMDWEFLMSATLVVISPPATSLWISSVVSRMLPWPCGSAWMEKEMRELIKNQYVLIKKEEMARWLEVLRRTPSDYGTFKTMKCGCCLRGTGPTAYGIRPTRKSLHKDKTRTNYWTADCSEARKSFQNEPKTGEQNNSGENIYHTSLAPASINIPASAVSCFCHGNKSEYPDPATS